MNIRYRFAEPQVRNVIEIDPVKGEIQTNFSFANIGYHMHMPTAANGGWVDIHIQEQSFEAEDLDQLIAFLECARDRLKKVG